MNSGIVFVLASVAMLLSFADCKKLYAYKIDKSEGSTIDVRCYRTNRTGWWTRWLDVYNTTMTHDTSDLLVYNDTLLQQFATTGRYEYTTTLTDSTIRIYNVSILDSGMYGCGINELETMYVRVNIAAHSYIFRRTSNVYVSFDYRQHALYDTVSLTFNSASTNVTWGYISDYVDEYDIMQLLDSNVPPINVSPTIIEHRLVIPPMRTKSTDGYYFGIDYTDRYNVRAHVFHLRAMYVHRNDIFRDYPSTISAVTRSTSVIFRSTYGIIGCCDVDNFDFWWIKIPWFSGRTVSAPVSDDIIARSGVLISDEYDIVNHCLYRYRVDTISNAIYTCLTATDRYEYNVSYANWPLATPTVLYRNESESVDIACVLYNSIGWMYDDKPLYSEETGFHIQMQSIYVISNNIIIISNLSINHSGTYSCLQNTGARYSTNLIIVPLPAMNTISPMIHNSSPSISYIVLSLQYLSVILSISSSLRVTL